MVSCPACSAIVFIDMDGHASMGMGIEEPANPEPSSSSSPSSSSIDPPHLMSAEPSVVPAAAHEPASESASAAAPVFDSGFVSDFDEPAPASTPVPASLAPDEFPMYQESPTGSGAEFSSVPDFGQPDDPLGLNEYANSELSSAKDGLLLFRIFISGIDSKEIRESIREAMDDRRFGWDPATLMSRASKGDLIIDNVTPIKATILINRIKRLPVRIRWEQYAITQMENP